MKHEKILLLVGLVSLLFMGCPNELELVAINVKANKVSYTVGESVAPSDIVVMATYSDGTSKVVTNYTVAPATFSEVGQASVTVTYSENDITVTASYEVSVISKLLINEDGTVEFGLWPRTIKDPAVTVEETESNKQEVGMFTYYKGDDDNWYCKALENAHGTDAQYKYSNNEQVKLKSENSSQWFKVEPIKWRVLTDNYSGKKLLFAEEGLYASIAYYDDTNDRTIDGKTIHPNNYEHSRIRAWLNGLSYNKSGSDNSDYFEKGFLQTAFTAAEQAKIAQTTVDNSVESTGYDTNDYACEDTNDKVFLLSYTEAANSEYGFTNNSVRIRKPTDFALANYGYLSPTDGYGGWYFLRSPFPNNFNRAWCVYGGGNLGDLSGVGSENPLVVPALCIN